MPKTAPSPTEEMVRLLQTLVARDMARSGVTQEEIGKHLHIAKAEVGPMVRGISKKKADA